MEGEDAERTMARRSFSLLGHEIRLDILLALLDRWMAVYTEPQSYAELMAAVGMQDSGKFNYHLEKLRGAYVHQVDGGYVPTASATALYRVVLAHRPAETLERERFDVDSTCPSCGGALVGTYDRGFLSVDCESCEEWVGFTYSFPRNGFEKRTGDEAVRATYRRCRHHVELARTGQCPFCAGPTTVDVRAAVIEDDSGHGVEIVCDTCTFHVGVELLFSVSFDDRVARALSDSGVDTERYYWELPEPTTRVESVEPLEVVLEIDGDDGRVSAVVDEDLEVCSVTVGQ